MGDKRERRFSTNPPKCSLFSPRQPAEAAREFIQNTLAKKNETLAK
jgi:hypothetical protein